MELATLKSSLKATARAWYHEMICAEYPIYKQINLSNGLEEGLADMKTYVGGKQTEEHALETAIDALTVTDVYDDFSTDSDANMKAFVASKMATLTTDDQKICIAIGLQAAERFDVA